MKDHELLGTLVLVHPDLENHPAGREGFIGIINYIDSPNNEVHVLFTDEAEAVYPADAIFRLKPKEEIYPSGGIDFAVPNLDSYKDLYKISLLQQMGRSTDIWSALQIARENPEIWKNSLLSVEESLGLRHNQYVGR